VRQLVRDLCRHFLEFDGFWNSSLDESFDKWSFFLFFGHHEVVADSKSVFEEQWRATALNSPFSHNTDPITEYVCLIHVVRCQDNYSILFVEFDHLPEPASCCGVHAWGRLV